MALVNLNADFNREDTRRAVEFGLEAVSAARSAGDRENWQAAIENLVIAWWQQARWDQIEELVLENQEAVQQTPTPRRSTPGRGRRRREGCPTS